MSNSPTNSRKTSSAHQPRRSMTAMDSPLNNSCSRAMRHSLIFAESNQTTQVELSLRQRLGATQVENE